MDRIKQELDRIGVWCEGYLTVVLALLAVLTDEVLTIVFGTGTARRYAERAQVDSILSVVLIAIVALVGLLVYTEVESSLTLDVQGARDDPANATVLENSSASVGDGFGDAIELVPVVLIVLVAALVIGVIQRFRS